MTYDATTGVITVDTDTATSGVLLTFNKVNPGNDPVYYTITTSQCGGATLTACVRRDTCTC